MKQFSKEERIDIEEIILIFVLEYDNSNQVLNHLVRNGIDNPKYFANKNHRTAFRIMLEMRDRKILVNYKSFFDFVKNKINSDRVIFDAYNKVVKITREYQAISNIDFYIFLFKEHVIVDFWNDAFKRYQDEDGMNKDIIDNSMYIKNTFNNLWEKFTTQHIQQVESSGLTLKEQAIQQRKNMREGIATSVKIGLSEFDEFTGGFENSEFYVLAGRPSMGKTSFAVSLAKLAIANNIVTHFFTLEMTKKQIINKFVSDDLGITYKDLKRGYVSDENFEKVLQKYDEYENHPLLIIDDLKTRTLSSLKKRLEEVDSKFVIIDYLQLMQLDASVAKKNQNREQEVGNISQNFKGFAKQFNRPILALSQLSRSVESRPGNRPILADLRESGSIEQDADVVMFVYREAYYLMQNNISVTEIQQGNIELIFAKGREIGLGKLKFWIDFKRNAIEEGFKF